VTEEGYPLPIMMKRVVLRTLRRIITQEELWNGNRETWGIIFSKDSMPLWVLRTYKKNRKDYSILLSKPEHCHIKVVHMKSPKTTQNWLLSLT